MKILEDENISSIDDGSGNEVKKYLLIAERVPQVLIGFLYFRYK
jgi:hypothetical protein